MRKKICIWGKSVLLEEVNPQYFDFIIKWRNDEILNKYLNQPYKLDQKKQQIWYENYLRDQSQSLMVIIDKNRHLPIGTIGFTNLIINNSCIEGRRLIGEREYLGSLQSKEAVILFHDYLFQQFALRYIFCHIVKNNFYSIRSHKRFGYIENINPVYTEELYCNGMEQTEFILSKERFYKLHKNK